MKKIILMILCNNDNIININENNNIINMCNENESKY